MLIGEKRYLDKGYAKEATLTLLRYAFDTLNLHRIYLQVLSDNVAAIRLYEKCACKKEGILRKSLFLNGIRRDITIMAVLKGEFQRSENKK